MEHSNVRKALMYPWYSGYKPGFSLQYDDIVGIQFLYGGCCFNISYMLNSYYNYSNMTMLYLAPEYGFRDSTILNFDLVRVSGIH